jgi:RNase H-fold protein (predicted Holliday junction resolvase)
MLHDLVREIRAKGGNELDAVRILQDFVDKRISSDEATARLKGLDVDKKEADKAKELSLAEQEEIVQLELREKQLMLQKLVSVCFDCAILSCAF